MGYYKDGSGPCDECGKPIGASDAVVIYWRETEYGSFFAFTCYDCRPRMAMGKRQCGNCKRTFYSERNRNLMYCCKRCRDEYYKTRYYHEVTKPRRIAARQNKRDKSCKSCGREFSPPRSDSVYCSNACRQKEYRERKKNLRIVEALTKHLEGLENAGVDVRSMTWDELEFQRESVIKSLYGPKQKQLPAPENDTL